MLENRYLHWLINFIEYDEYDVNKYSKLLENLYLEEFYWILPMDKNRSTDGLELREEYISKHSINSDDIFNHLDGKCSVLEMLIAMCRRAERDIMSDEQFGNRTGEWFWEILSNLGFVALTDDKWIDKIFYLILYRFLDRTYSPTGVDGPFHIPNSPTNLQKVELWYQFNWYLSEYFIGVL